MRFTLTGTLILLFAFLACGQPAESGPADCRVRGVAILDAVRIRGTLELAPASSCFDFQPFARLRYVHPEYRDLHIREIPLQRGRKVPFEFILDSRDLARAIQFVQVVVYVRSASGADPVPVSSFWLEVPTSKKAHPEQATSPEGSFLPLSSQSRKVEDLPCDEIRNLTLENHPAQPTAPTVLSWDQPACCRDKACTFAVWGGQAPEELRLLTHGQAAGSRIHKILDGLYPEDTFFELIVETPAGDRHAFCQKPLRELIPTPTPSPPVLESVPEKSTPPSEENLPQSPEAVVESLALKQARLSVTDFAPCRYERTLAPSGNHIHSAGEPIEIRYDHDRKGYRYTLYFSPAKAKEWYLAPGTTEMQEKPAFRFRAAPEYSGKYLILVYKPAKKWGCLSSEVDEALQLQIKK